MMTIVGQIGIHVAIRFDDYEGLVRPTIELSHQEFPGMWIQWDSGWYLAIVREGYAARPDSQGFFPVYPLLISAVVKVTGLSSAWSAIIIAQMSYLGAILSLYKLARIIRDEHTFAIRTVLFLICFPTSFFFIAAYAESVLLFLSIMSAYLLLRPARNLWISAVAAGIAAASRPTGWILGVMYLVEFIKMREFTVKSVLRLFTAGLITISGIVAFSFYLYLISGSATSLADVQGSEWKLTWQFPLLTIIDSIEIIFDNTYRDNWFLYVLNIFDLAFGVFVIVMTTIGVRLSLQGRFPWSLTAFLFVSIIFLFSRLGFQVPLDEMARWAAILFPIYPILALLTQNRVNLTRLSLSVSGLLLLGLSAWWATGRWVG